MADSWLSDFSNALIAAADLKEQRRKLINDWLEKQGALIFVRDQDPDVAGCGVGWFHIGPYIQAYQRYSNGYADTPLLTLEVSFLTGLMEKLQQE